MGLIWDSMDAQSLNGKGISGTPVAGSPLFFDGTLWRPVSPSLSPSMSVVDDFDAFTYIAAGNLTSGQFGRLGWTKGGVGTPNVYNPGNVGLSDFGIVRVETSAGIADRTIISAPFNLGSPFNPASGWRGQYFDYYFRVYLDGVVAGTAIWVGVTPTNTPVTGGNGRVGPLVGIGIYRASGGSTWVGSCFDGGSENSASLGTAITTDYQWLRIRRASATTAKFSFATTFAGLATATETELTVNTTSTHYPAVQVSNTTANIASVVLDYFGAVITQNTTNTR